MSIDHDLTASVGTHRGSPRRTGGTPSGGERDPFFDNAKLLALGLVLCGHFWEPLVQQHGNRPLHALYLLVYTFHMPVFVFVSGYFSRSYTGRPRQVQRLISGILVPYLLWSTLLGLCTEWLQGRHLTVEIITPSWITWFLLSLFFWRLTAPFWAQVKAPLTIAVALSIAAGALPVGREVSLGRTLELLPFFVAGLTLSPTVLQRVRTSAALRFTAVPLFAAAGVCAYWAVPRIGPEWFYRADSAAALHSGYLRWILLSLALNAVGALLGLLFLSLVPRGRGWITPLGAASMYGFLLHPFIQRALIHEHLYATTFVNSPAGQLSLTAAALVLALILCSPLVVRIARPVVEPRLTWLFRRAEG